MQFIKKNFFRYCLIALLLPLTLNGQKNNSFEISKNLDLFNSLYKELEMLYVDTMNVEKNISTAIDAMLNNLDPYTTYIPASEEDDFEYMRTGEYGGIGALISSRDSMIYVAEIYENMPAQKAGLKAGDKLLSIDNQSLKGKTTSQVSAILKGVPGTSFDLVIESAANNEKQTIKVTREKIVVPSVPYSGFIAPNIGYIYLSSFTDKSADNVKQALLDLKKEQPSMQGLVFDLRGNPGGILEEALRIINYFVPAGKEILSTKGKIKQWDKTYRTTSSPLDTELPLVILLDGGSASASEVVAGALQDLDRAVIIGEKSFGKGLVQTTRPLPYEGILKVTVSKYFTPSGRCIQSIDYYQSDKKGKAITEDKQAIFKTSTGRQVKDGGGISPDIAVKADSIPAILYSLSAEGILFDYATYYSNKHKNIAPAGKFTFTDNDYEDFKAFVQQKEFKYDKRSEKLMEELRKVARFEGYYNQAEEEFKQLETKLKHDVQKDLDHAKEQTIPILENDIVERYYFQRGAIMQSLKKNPEISQAIDLLNNPKRYYQILNQPIPAKKKR